MTSQEDLLGTLRPGDRIELTSYRTDEVSQVTFWGSRLVFRDLGWRIAIDTSTGEYLLHRFKVKFLSRPADTSKDREAIMTDEEHLIDTFRPGDRIELTHKLTGDVYQTTFKSVRSERGTSLTTTAGVFRVDKYEIRFLSRPVRPEPKVGDIIPGSDVIDLYAGSVVRNANSNYLWVILWQKGNCEGNESKVIQCVSRSERRHTHFNTGSYRVEYVP